MDRHPLDAWSRPGGEIYNDMPGLVEAPPLGPSIPPPPGARYEGGGGMFTAFPGVAAGPSPGHAGHTPLPQFNQNPHHPAHHLPHLPYPHNTNPYPHHPHFQYTPFPFSPFQPLPALHHQAGPSWHGYPHPHSQFTPGSAPYPHLPHPAWPNAQVPGHEIPHEDPNRGRPERNWFVEKAESERRARSQSVRRRKRSKSPFAGPFPGFGAEGGVGLEGDSYFGHEGEDNPWQKLHGAHGHGHGHEHGGETDWDALDRGFGGLAIGGGGGGKGRGILKKPRSNSFSGGVHPPALHHRSTSNPNPIFSGYHLTYEQHMQRNGLYGGREDELPYRPSTWRTEYSVKGGMMDALFRQNSDVRVINDNVKRTLHPHLLYDSASPLPPISLDLRLNPRIPSTLTPALSLLTLPKNPHKLSEIDLVQFATHPPTSNMRLFHKRLPWYIDVVNRTGYITVQDIIHALHNTLTGSGMGGKSQVTAAEYWCGEMGEHVDVATSTPTATPLRSLAPLPGLGWSGQRRPKRTAREQVSMSWRVRGQLAHTVEWLESLARGYHDDLARQDGVKAEQDELERGVRRVDWLAIGSNVDDQRTFRWIGLKKGRRGMWEVVTEV
ncbi:hypothetical protein PM082_012367 [Marasmius tenuissimus]|nr:hypothetical protein PM082_012367 [Marasmius tenuissimus]